MLHILPNAFTSRTLSTSTAWWVLLVGVIAASAGACEKDTPSAPTTTVVDLRITGPNTILIGQTSGYTATATYSDGTSSAVTASWVSATTAVAEISSVGQVTAWTAGTTILSASFNGRTATLGVQVNNPLVGKWLLTASSNPGNPSGIGTRVKTLTATDWEIVQTNPTTGATVFRHGGRYTLRGTDFSETVEFANASTASLIGQTFTSKVTASADRFTQVSTTFNEEWSRIP